MKRMNADDCALVLVDLQSAPMAMLDKAAQALIIRNLEVTLSLATGFELPVIVTSNMEDGPFGSVLDVIEKQAPDAFASRIPRTGVLDAFASEGFRASVEATGCRTLLLAGFPTDICVLQTALSAIEREFDVCLLLNCCGSPSRIATETAIRRMEKAGAISASSISAMAEMTGGYHTRRGQILMRVLIEQLVMSDSGPLD